jgi:hypothetical protein
MKPKASIFCLALASLAAQPAAAQVPADLQNPKIDIAYVEPTNPDYRPIYERLKKRQVLEELKQFMAPLTLPETILVKVDECGSATSTIRPAMPVVPVVVCYEYVQQLERLAPAEKTPQGVSRANAIAGAFVMGALHEMAHAVFSVLKIPVWGREEDAADKLAAYVMLSLGEDVALRTLTGTASFFEASKRTWSGSDFSDINSPEEQRYYNYLCMAYGSNPDLFKEFVRPTLLKTQRGDGNGCLYEYVQVKAAFANTIMKHIDPNLLKVVKENPQWWLRPDDGGLR